MEEWWDILWEDVGCVGATARFMAPRCEQPRRRSGWAPQAWLNGAVKMILHIIQLLVGRTLYITGYGNHI
jgi:hypothetical protein